MSSARPSAVRRRIERLQTQVGTSGEGTTVGSGAAAGAGAGAGVSRDDTGCFWDDFAGATIADAYDYVIIGGGTAGCALAARLSEDPEVTVLLVEAGGADDTNLNVKIIGMLTELQRSKVDWQFSTKCGPELNNRTLFIPRGKLLGGCSSINACAWVRGDPENFNGWARAGCKGWSYDEVLPYFKKLENCALFGADPVVRGKGGPVNVVDTVAVDATHPLAAKWIQAAGQVGLPTAADYNTDQYHVFGPQQSNCKNGWRHSMAAAYLRQDSSGGNRPAMARPNLTVATLTHATRIVFQGTRAVGVRYRRGSTDAEYLRRQPELMVSARREVLLCAGTINSPWLLLLSGVGPAAQLKKLGIDVVADLPVGENLQDHLFSSMWWKTTSAAPSPLTLTMSAATAKAGLKFLFQGRGEAMVSPLQCSGFALSGLEPHADDHAPDAADLQLHFAPFCGTEQFLKNSNMLNTGTHTRPENLPKFAITTMACCVRPQSRGTVTLKSSDPFEYPHLEFNFLSRKRDEDVLVRGLQMARKIIGADAFGGLIEGECVDESIPHAVESDEYLREYIRRTTITIYHPVGTCRMGDPAAPTTVVDPRCRVVGLQGLRVADASAIPFVTSGNTMAPVVMLAEKVADLVKEDRSV